MDQIANAVRSAGLDGAMALLDAGTTDPNADIRIGTSGLATILAELQMSNPAMLNAIDGVADADTIEPEDSALDDGVAAHGQVRDRDNVQCWRFTVGGSGSSEDLRLSETNVSAEDVISIATFEVEFPDGGA